MSIFFPSLQLQRDDPDDPFEFLVFLLQSVVFQDGYLRFRLMSNPAINGFVRYRILPGGIRNKYDGSFSVVGYSAYFWSATEYGSPNAWCRSLTYPSSNANRINYYKPGGVSVRCVKDN